MSTSTLFTPARFGVIHTAPAWMPEYERVVLYATVVGLRPQRVLEIGTFKGGSTVVMCAALDDLDAGQIVCVDPDPRVAPETWEAVEHRATMVAEGSPGALLRAREIAGQPFDFVLIDGDHSYEGVIRDIEGTLPTLADEAHLLFHDAHFVEVADAIDAMIERVSPQLDDAGLISRGNTVEDGVRWGGLRLLRYRRQPPPRQSSGDATAARLPVIPPGLPDLLARGPRRSAAPRGPLRSAARQLVLRATRPLAAYQDSVNLQLLESLRALADEVTELRTRGR